MRRTNIFLLKSTGKQGHRLFRLTGNCFQIYSGISYKGGQFFFSRGFNWGIDESYYGYRKLIVSTLVQQILVKNGEAWMFSFAVTPLPLKIKSRSFKCFSVGRCQQ